MRRADTVNFPRFIYRDFRPGIPDSIPSGLSELIVQCWDQDPACRPSFQQIVNSFDDLLVDSLVEDAIGRKLWKREFRGQVVM
jgi:hypothetical protein